MTSSENCFTFIDIRGPNTQESGLGELDNAAAFKALKSAKGNVREKYANYTSVERCDIGKYANEMGTAAVLTKFRKERPNLNKSTVRTFVKKYKDELKQAAREKRTPKRIMEIQKRGRPLLLGRVDEMVRNYLSATRQHGGVGFQCYCDSNSKSINQMKSPIQLGSYCDWKQLGKKFIFQDGLCETNENYLKSADSRGCPKRSRANLPA